MLSLCSSILQSIHRRERGVVTEVRNQGLCGACWAHSVIETIESMLAIERNSSAIDLSVQQMVDCAANNNGCLGGDTCNLLEWLVRKNVSIHTMGEYPMGEYRMNDVETQCHMGEIRNISETVRVNKFTCDR